MTRKEDDEENENEEGENDASSIKKGIILLECILKAFRSLYPPPKTGSYQSLLLS